MISFTNVQYNHDICQHLQIVANCSTIDVNDQVQTVAKHYHG